MFADPVDDEQIIARVAALDIGKSKRHSVPLWEDDRSRR